MPELIKTYRSSFHYLTIIFLLSCGYINGQEFYIEQFGPDEGLPSSETYHILQDSDGYFWICTDRGIVKYDTYDFTVYDNSTPGIDDHTFFKGYEFGDEIWFTAYNRTITVYNKENQSFTTLTDHLPLIGDDRFISFISKHENIIYIYFEEGSKPNALSYNERGEFAVINVLNAKILDSFVVNKIYYYDIDLPGDPVLEKRQRSAAQNIYSGNNPKYCTEEIITLKRDFLNNTKGNYIKIYSVQELNGHYYILSSKGLFKVEGNQRELLQSTFQISCLFEDNEESIWLTTLNNGLLKTSRLEKNIAPISLGNNEKITAVYRKNGHLVLGTSLGKVVLLATSNNSFEEYDDNNVPIFQVYEYDNKVWINGIYFLRSENLEKGLFRDIFTKPSTQLTDELKYLEPEKSNQGFHTLKIGRYRIISNSGKQKGYSIENENGEKIYNDKFVGVIQSLSTLNYSSAYIATLNGLYELDTVDLFSPKLLPIFPDSTVRINKIKNGSDFIAIASSGSGFAIYRNEKPFVYNGPISSPLINSIALVGDTIVYLGTNKGIDKVKMIHSDDSTGFKYISTYSNMDVLLSNYVYDLCYSHDKIWYSTDEGLAWFNINDTIPIIPAPKIHIDYISVSDSIIDDPIKALRNYENDIVIHFTGISTKRPKKNFYKYILEKNNKKNPIQYTDSREVRFNDLSYGNYVFYVSAQNYQGTWSEYKTVHFKIKPHLLQTFWFVSLLVIGFLGGVYMIYQYRLRRIQEREEGKNRILQLEKDFNDAVLSSIQSQINPHFVFNALQSIQGYILKNDIETASDYLAKFSKIMRSGLEFSSLEFVNLEDEIEFLNNYLNIEKLRFPSRFNFKIVYDSDLLEEGIKIPPLVLQPIIENAVKHAFPENDEQNLILVSFEYLESKNVLRSIVEDNGIGFFNTKSVNFGHGQHISKGISLVNRRVDLLKQKYGQGSYGLLSRPNESGTKIVIELPIA